MRADFDPYEVLGISRSAGAGEVRRAYLRIVKKHHPDVTGGDKSSEWMFKQATRAYEMVRTDELDVRGSREGKGEERRQTSNQDSGSSRGGRWQWSHVSELERWTFDEASGEYVAGSRWWNVGVEDECGRARMESIERSYRAAEQRGDHRPANVGGGWFTLWSTAEDVLAVQGVPDWQEKREFKRRETIGIGISGGMGKAA